MDELLDKRQQLGHAAEKPGQLLPAPSLAQIAEIQIAVFGKQVRDGVQLPFVDALVIAVAQRPDRQGRKRKSWRLRIDWTGSQRRRQIPLNPPFGKGGSAKCRTWQPPLRATLSLQERVP